MSQVETLSKKSSILEKGDVFFFYRPKLRSRGQKEAGVEGLEEVQRFYMILHPDQSHLFRLLLIGRKKLPEIKKHGEVNWALVDVIAKNHKAISAELQEDQYDTKTRGERVRPAARAVGEGIYSLVLHEGHSHFAYVLELPKSPHEVQQALAIEPEGSYIISVKNQAVAGSMTNRIAAFPKALQQKFADRRFISLESPDFLNYEGAELLLIGAAKEAEKGLGIRFHEKSENERTVDIFKELQLWKENQIIKPLLEGKWS